MILMAAAGVALLVTLLLKHELSEVAAAISAARWAIVGILAVHMVQLIPETLGWYALLPRGYRFKSLYWISWIGESVTALLPFTQVAGDFVRARLAITRGMPAPIAASTVLIDITMSVAVQVLYTLIGIVLLLIVTGSSSLTFPALIGAILLLVGSIGFYLVQHYGMFGMLSRLIARLSRGSGWRDLIAQGDAFDQEVRKLYARRRAVIANGASTLVCWLLSAVEVWIAMRAMGVRAGFAEACILESVSRAVRTSMFVVPGALGLQEGGYVVTGRLLGIGPETSLALALIRRFRELAVGVPALLLWQWVEGRRLWRRRRRGRSVGADSARPSAAVGATASINPE